MLIGPYIPIKTKFHSRKICKIVLNILEIPRLKTKNHGNSTRSFLDHPWKFLIVNLKRSGISRGDQEKIVWNFHGSWFSVLQFPHAISSKPVETPYLE